MDFLMRFGAGTRMPRLQSQKHPYGVCRHVERGAVGGLNLPRLLLEGLYSQFRVVDEAPEAVGFALIRTAYSKARQGI